MTKNQTKNPAQPAEFPDDSDIDAGADYDGTPSFDVLGGSEKFHYFFAAKSEDGSPQTVEACKLQGYEVCTEEKALNPSGDRVLMRLPAKTFNARRDAKRKRRIAARKQTMRPKGIPDGHLHELDSRGDRPGAGEEWQGE